MKLYFQHSNGDMEYICEVASEELYVSMALKDLKRRAPNFKSYYQRVWKDEDECTWIDVGDHCCFYIVKDD